MGVVAAPSVMDARRVLSRWVQLIAGIVAMMAIANLQYAWTLFTTPLTQNLHVSLTAVQVAFATFILAETWLVPFEGYLVDKIGPRLMLAAGGVLVAVGWIGAGKATTVRELVVLYTIGGIGAGVVYGGTIGNALKWFPDRRGLCVGLTAGAYGVGTALTVAPIAHMIKSSGYAHTFIVWGTIQGALVLLAALFINKPPAGWAPPGWREKEEEARQYLQGVRERLAGLPRKVQERELAAALKAAGKQFKGIPLKLRVRTSALDMTPGQMVRQGSFWVIYLMMTMVAFGGLVVTAQLSPIAKFYHVDKVVMAFGMSALVLAIEVDRVLNGLTRPFWGWVSDHLGRENTMFIAFLLEALAVFGLIRLAHHPTWFILMSGFCFFAWGEIFSLFPSIVGDLYGNAWCTTNYGIVYTAKGVASIFAGPVAALASVKTGSWIHVFWVMMFCDLIAAFIALFWLKPVAARTVARAEVMASEAAAQAPPVRVAA
jgi:OFA family oxalate/formate antiporter-like MFS transporter